VRHSAHQRVTQLAELTAVHRAFHWLHLHQLQIRRWQLELVRIPAPTFDEQLRAGWFLERFQQLGLSNVHLDEEGNVLSELSPVKNCDSPCLLLSAHLDTVFPSGISCEPREDSNSQRIYAPGICDNAAGLSALLAIAAALRHARIDPPIPILFAANVGEEGEGDLRGMRHLFLRGPHRNRIVSAIVLDGAGTSAVVTSGLGSLRFRATITGPGGHSWYDAGAPNPILILADALTTLGRLPLPADPLTTLNVGHISGGTSINSIPSSASALIDLRSSSPASLTIAANAVRGVFDALCSTLHPCQAVTVSLESIGERPAASLPPGSSLLSTLRAVDRHLALSTEQRLASTDANIPLSLGIPAITVGTGGTGGGTHTLDEWYDPTGREIALRRILLTLLATVQIISESHPSHLHSAP
jgi:acetylornithine deacetylase/succinyl-diaminopimelate desuccinylase-like protein